MKEELVKKKKKQNSRGVGGFLSNGGSDAETGWDLGTFSALLAPGQKSPQATGYKETKRD